MGFRSSQPQSLLVRCIRIGSSFSEPATARMLVTYPSYDDLVEALRCSLMTARVGHTILFGMSDNPAKWWDNRKAGHLGFMAKDSSTVFNDKFPPSGNCPAADGIGSVRQGGPFILNGPQLG